MPRCRACLRSVEPHDALPLARRESPDSPALVELLAEVARVQVDTGDGLPEDICTECHERLQISRAFIERVHESHRILCEGSNRIAVNGNGDGDSEGNCADICDEIGITIESNKSGAVDNFLSIVYSDKAIQVDLDRERSNPRRIFHAGDSVEYASEDSIKREPEEEDYDHSGVDLSTIQIKIEPLSEDAALRFHQAATSGTDNVVDDSDSDVEVNLNVSNNSDNLCIEDIKPTQEELEAYAENINLADAIEEDTMSSPSSRSRIETVDGRPPDESEPFGSQERCVLCNKDFLTKNELKRHVIHEHSYYECLKCSHCGVEFMSSSDLNDHMLVHNLDEFEFFCPLCNKDYENDEHFKTHLGVHREIVLLKRGDSETTLCSRCNKSFGNLSELFSHIENYCEFTPLDNDVDNKEFINDLDGFADDSSRPPDKKIKVERGFDDPEGFITRKLLDNVCPHCSEKCENIYMLKIHLKTHNNSFRKVLERCFVCTLCMFKFKRKDHLIRHLINVHRVTSENRRNKLMLML